MVYADYNYQSSKNLTNLQSQHCFVCVGMVSSNLYVGKVMGYKFQLYEPGVLYSVASSR